MADTRLLLGVFGGTFDPVHFGHLRLAEEVAESLELEAVHFVPAAVPPHRHQPVAPAADRLELVAAAIADNDRFVFDDREHRRTGPSYMVDTLADFRRTHPAHTLVLLLGMDAFNGLTRWHRWAEILELAHVAVATRPGSEVSSAVADLLHRHAMTAGEIRRADNGGIVRVDITRLDISATAIRAALAQGRSVRYLVPEKLDSRLGTISAYHES